MSLARFNKWRNREIQVLVRVLHTAIRPEYSTAGIEQELYNLVDTGFRQGYAMAKKGINP
jgi:hypothetical protein